MTNTEIVELAVAYAELRQYYGSSVIDPRLVAAVGLVGAAWSVYEPKLKTLGLRKIAERALAKAQKAQAQGGAHALPIRPNGSPSFVTTPAA